MTGSSSTTSALRVTLCRDEAGFAALAEDWQRLFARCGTATPFQTHTWLHSWWRTYGVPGRLRLVLVRRGGELVGAAPLTLAFRPWPVWVPLGGAISDFCDVLLADGPDGDGPDDDVARALARGLRRAARTALVDLREVRPGAAAERLHAHWDGPRSRRPDSVCLELPGVPIEQLLERMPTVSARRSRAKLRKLERLDLSHRDVPEDEVPEAVARMLHLHTLQWQDRGATPEHLTPRFAEHLVRATSGMVRDGHAQLTEYHLDGELVAGDVTLMSPSLAGGYLYGVHPALRRRLCVTTMLLRRDAGHAAGTGRATLSLMRGTEPYKRHWRPQEVVNQRLLLARPELGPLLVAYERQLDARDRLADALRPHRPRLRGAVDRVRGVAVRRVPSLRRGGPTP